jgi:hypothetical protein
MSTDPHATSQPAKAQPARDETPQHEPRVPGGKIDEPGMHPDHPNKPFRTPSKNKTHAAPEAGTDGDPEARRADPKSKAPDSQRKN